MSGEVSDRIRYHLAEAQIVADRDNPRRCMPTLNFDGLRVLDIGCGIGQTLMAPEFSGAVARFGIDIDREAIEYGQVTFPGLNLQVASAEDVPFPDEFFDFVYSRVAIPYTNIPRALQEMHRVVRRGGKVWMSLHPFRLRRLTTKLRSADVKGLIDLAYVYGNGILFGLTGRCFARPWRRDMTESVQGEAAMRRAMIRAGFHDVCLSIGRHYVASATR